MSIMRVFRIMSNFLQMTDKKGEVGQSENF